MNALSLGVALLLSLLLVAGWVLLLSTPLAALSAATAGGVTKGVAHVRRLASAAARDTVSGILCIDGLDSEPALAKHLRAYIARVLKLAARDTRPRACACIKASKDASIGVLRVFNSKGHDLLRESGRSAAAVATRLSAALEEFKDVFPAKAGARRIQCPECNPKTCPLRRLKLERTSVTA